MTNNLTLVSVAQKTRLSAAGAFYERGARPVMENNVDQTSEPKQRDLPWVVTDHEESDNRHQALIGALDVLNERERRIFEARRLADDPVTLEDLATEFGVSRERVRQIEVRAFEKVQKAVKTNIAAIEQPKQAPAIAAH